MSDLKLLDSNGLSLIAGYVNKKLDKVTEMPANPPDSQTVLYIGATGVYTKGHLYQYSSTSSNWADITPASEPSTVTVSGQMALTYISAMVVRSMFLTQQLLLGLLKLGQV